MKNKFKKLIISITAILLLLGAAVSSLAFINKIDRLNSSFTCTSNYATKAAADSPIIDYKLNLKQESAVCSTEILAFVDDNAQKKAEEINNIYLSEVKGNNNSNGAVAAETGGNVLNSAPANLSGIESTVLSIINNIRTASGLSALSANQMLTDIARSRCQDMISRNYFSHYTPEGKNIFNIFSDCGVKYVNAGENLGNSCPASCGTPDAFANAWMNSSTHKANILRSCYTKVGIGVVDGGGRRVVATVFMN